MGYICLTSFSSWLCSHTMVSQGFFKLSLKHATTVWSPWNNNPEMGRYRIYGKLQTKWLYCDLLLYPTLVDESCMHNPAVLETCTFQAEKNPVTITAEIITLTALTLSSRNAMTCWIKILLCFKWREPRDLWFRPIWIGSLDTYHSWCLLVCLSITLLNRPSLSREVLWAMVQFNKIKHLK